MDKDYNFNHFNDVKSLNFKEDVIGKCTFDGPKISTPKTEAYCTCCSKNNIGLHATELDKEGTCIKCGYYPVYELEGSVPIKKNRKGTWKVKRIKCVETGEIYSSVHELSEKIERTVNHIRVCIGSGQKVNKLKYVYVKD